jgi:hypothetical protein
VEAFSTVIVERIVDTLGVVILLFAAMPLVHFAGGATKPAIVLTALTVVLLAALMLAARHKSAVLRLMVRGTRWLPEAWRQPAVDRAEAAFTGLGALTDARAGAEVLGLTALIYLVLVAGMEAQLVAFHLRLPVAAPFFLLGAAALGLVVPAPAGIGVWEGIIITILTSLFAVERTQAAGLAVVSHVVFFAPPIVFAAIYLWRLGASWGTLVGLTRRDATLEAPAPSAQPE